MKNKGLKATIVILVLIFLIALFIFLYYQNQKPQNKEKLDESTLNILYAGWNFYQIEDGKFTNKPLDWNYLCKNEQESGLYTIKTKQYEDLLCYNIINGKDSVMGLKWVRDIGETEVISSSDYLSLYRSNQITICCSSDKKEGEICKSVTISARC